MPAGFRRHLVGKTLRDNFHCDIAEIRFVDKLVIIQTFHKPADRMLFKQHDKSSPLNFTHYAKLYPQNGERIVTIDSLTSFYPMHTQGDSDVILFHIHACRFSPPFCR